MNDIYYLQEEGIKEFGYNEEIISQNLEKLMSSLGIYNPIDYSKNPKMYCGMEINSTPMKL